MNKIEVDKEEILKMWNSSFTIVQQLQHFPHKQAEYYYNIGVIDACRMLIGEKELKC